MGDGHKLCIGCCPAMLNGELQQLGTCSTSPKPQPCNPCCSLEFKSISFKSSMTDCFKFCPVQDLVIRTHKKLLPICTLQYLLMLFLDRGGGMGWGWG